MVRLAGILYLDGISMSSSLHWRPAPKPTPEETLSSQLKAILSDAIWSGEYLSSKVTITSHDTNMVSYLKGLMDAGVEDADELYQAVLKHSAVELWIS